MEFLLPERRTPEVNLESPQSGPPLAEPGIVRLVFDFGGVALVDEVGPRSPAVLGDSCPAQRHAHHQLEMNAKYFVFSQGRTGEGAEGVRRRNVLQGKVVHSEFREVQCAGIDEGALHAAHSVA